MQSQVKNQSGFTIIEILVVVSLLTIVLTLTTTSLFTPLGRARTENLSVDIISLLRQAQSYAINSETLGSASATSFGVHFTNSTYSLFQGNIYNPTDPNNLVVDIPAGLMVSQNLPCSGLPNDCNNIVFNQRSGEIANFDPGKNSICVSNNSNSSTLVSFNYLGVMNAQEGAC